MTLRMLLQDQMVVHTHHLKWPMIQIVLDIPNEDLVEHDLYEIQTIVDQSDGVHIMGDKCIFEVTAIPLMYQQ